MTNRYQAFAEQLHVWGANVTAKRRADKGILHTWKHLCATRQTIEELRGYPWATAGGVGVIMGVGGWRGFDLDHATTQAPLDQLRATLGLSADYAWQYRSGSGEGYGLVIICDDPMPADTLPSKKKESSVFWGYPEQSAVFDHLELRWNQHCVLPPSSYVFGKGERAGTPGPGYQWLYEPPIGPPSPVPIHRVIDAFYALCPPKPHTLGSMPDAVRTEIRARFDLVAYFRRELGGEEQRDGPAVRLLGHGGLLINNEKGVWHAFSDELGGDCFDAVAYCRYRTQARNLNGKSAEVLAEAAAFAGVRVPPREVIAAHTAVAATAVAATPAAQFVAPGGRVQPLAAGSADGTEPYFIEAGGLWMRQTDKDGNPKAPMPLTNWTAAITAELSLHDGDTVQEHYALEATCGGRTKQLELARDEFESETAVSQIVAALGARARVNPRAQAKFIIDAIKTLSETYDEHVMYTHSGWVNNRYLSGNGYVDQDGWHPARHASDSRAHLPQKLARYTLTPPADTTIVDGMAVLSDLLELAPNAVMVPLLGAVLLSVISRDLDMAAPMVHIVGTTGAHKTALACCALALFGDFAASGTPTDTWTSTANSVQKLGWHLMHAPMVLDDYKAKNVKDAAVIFLLQNYGDNMARGRLDAESKLKIAYPIRAVLISSGEDQPEGEASTLARILSVHLMHGTVRREKLTQVQAQSHCLHHVTIAYLQWLASRGGAWKAKEIYHQMRTRVIGILDQVEHATNPGRVASNVATLYVAWHSFCQFLVEKGHWSRPAAESWLGICKDVLTTLAEQQLNMTTGERYSEQFLDALRALLASDKVALLASPTGAAPPGTTPIGYRCADGTAMVVAQSAYDEVAKASRSTGRQIGYSLRALSQMLDQDGHLASKARGFYVRPRVNGVLCYCWHLTAHPLA